MVTKKINARKVKVQPHAARAFAENRETVEQEDHSHSEVKGPRLHTLSSVRSCSTQCVPAMTDRSHSVVQPPLQRLVFDRYFLVFFHALLPCLTENNSPKIQRWKII